DDVDLLAVVDLVPDGLQPLTDRRRVRVAPVHEASAVFEAAVARLQLFVIEDAHAALADDLVAVEGEVDFLDAVPLGARAEFGFRPRRAAAEQDAIASVHAPRS